MGGCLKRIRSDAEIVWVPAVGDSKVTYSSPEFSEIQEWVGGPVEIVYADTTQVLCNEEGRMRSLPANERMGMIGLDFVGNVVILAGFELI